MTFDYFKTTQVNGTLEIEDVGNCAIQAFSDTGLTLFLVTKTIMGWTYIYTAGPFLADTPNLILKEMNCHISKFEYDIRKINTAINKFLNNSTYTITQAMPIIADEEWNSYPDLKNLFISEA